jgi:acyl-CoA synthetase (AMP-forming)/AMP-acid ligase II
MRDRPELHAALAERAATVQPSDDALLLYTSGSTGRPKGVVHTHRSIVSNIDVEVQYFPFTESDVTLVHFPINHVAATVEIVFAAIYGGSRMVHMDQFDPVASLEAIEHEGVTMVGGVPVMFLMQMQTPNFAQMDWSKVRAFVWAGAAAPRRMIEALNRVVAQTGARLITGYGATEMAGFVTYTEPDDDIDTLADTVGHIVPPFELKIAGDDGQELSDGEVGEVAVRGPFLMDRYLNKPDATAAVLRDSWYYSGDLGSRDARGYVTLTGRRSEMFKTGGENVFPREIEEVLERHPAVLFAAVLGVKDDFYGEVGRAFIMVKPGQQTEPDELRAHCKSALANFKVPKHFDVRAQLPLLPNGKVNKPVLRADL